MGEDGRRWIDWVMLSWGVEGVEPEGDEEKYVQSRVTE